MARNGGIYKVALLDKDVCFTMEKRTVSRTIAFTRHAARAWFLYFIATLSCQTAFMTVLTNGINGLGIKEERWPMEIFNRS